MFALIISGRPVDTNIQQIDSSRYCFNIADARSIRKLALFTINPIPIGYIAKIYIMKDLNQWHYLGSLSPSRSSIIVFLLPPSSQSFNSNSSFSFISIALDQSQIGISIEQGISNEGEEDTISNSNMLAASLPSSSSSMSIPSISTAIIEGEGRGREMLVVTGSTGNISNIKMAEIGETARLIGENLFNYISSFSRNVLGEEIVPLKCVQEWYQGFLRKDLSRWLNNILYPNSSSGNSAIVSNPTITPMNSNTNNAESSNVSPFAFKR